MINGVAPLRHSTQCWTKRVQQQGADITGGEGHIYGSCGRIWAGGGTLGKGLPRVRGWHTDEGGEAAMVDKG